MIRAASNRIAHGARAGVDAASALLLRSPAAAAAALTLPPQSRCSALWVPPAVRPGLGRLSADARRGFANNRANRGTINSDISPTIAAKVAAEKGTAPHALATSLTIGDVLSRYQADGRTFTCKASVSLYEAVAIMVSSRVGCLVAMEDDGEHVAGMITERDILSELVRLQDGAQTETSDWTRTPVSAAMTRSREMVHCRLGDRIDDALNLMASQGFRHLPVLDLQGGTDGGAHLRGMVSMRNLVDIIYKHANAGGKAQFLQDVLPRTGVPKNTTALRKRRGDQEQDNLPSLFLNAGVCAIPHPDKKVGEDSYVVAVANTVSGMGSPPADSEGPLLRHPLSVLAVFDGVGQVSFETGITDAANFSYALSENLRQYVSEHPALHGGSGDVSAPRDTSAPPPALSPQNMLSAIWDRVVSDKVPGSSTACILSLAHHSNELRAANIGDSGFLVLRLRDAQRIGSVGVSLHSQQGDWQVVYRSPQQLHYFNCPLQIGIGRQGESDLFESPLDADLLGVPVQKGDIIILATDGLFDNVPEESIVEEFTRSMEALENEEEKKMAESNAAPVPRPFFEASGPGPRSTTRAGPESPLKPVAVALTQLALRLSLDKMTDSPFAVLAKDNNIMWKNGGRKDDITVIVARVEALPTPLLANAQMATSSETDKKEGDNTQA